MKKPNILTPIAILFCACLVFSHAGEVARAFSCPWWKTGPPFPVSTSREAPPCCGVAKCCSTASESSSQDASRHADTNPEDGCCSLGLCGLFQANLFLTTGPGISIHSPDCYSLPETGHSLLHSGFERLLFRPPQV